MFSKKHQLGWLKSRTFWQVAFSLIAITALTVASKGISLNSNSFTNILMDYEPNSTQIKKD